MLQHVSLNQIWLGLLVLRVSVGVTMIAHGYNHIYRGGRIKGTAGWFASLGMKPGILHAWLASITELAAGLGLVVGLLTPLAAGAIFGVLAVALITNHRTAGFFVFRRPTEGWEYLMNLLAACVAIGCVGPGRWSLDNALGFHPGGWWGLGIVLVIGVGGTVGLLAVFWRPPAPRPRPEAAAGARMIELEHVGKIFPGQRSPAVGDLSLEVLEGEIAVLIGPSGCGKSTTLRMINRLIEPTSGRIVVAGRDVSAQKPHELRLSIGYVIQQVGLFPHRTIARNIATVPELLGWNRARTKARVEELMDLVGLDAELGARYPTELSGGQQQRVGVARALAADPPVLLMDEPFAAVDPIVRQRLQEELVDLQRRLHKTIVFVTHDLDEAMRLGDRMAVLNVGGVLEQYGPPVDVLAEPASPFVVEFLGADRGLKRLALIPVSAADLQPGPAVDAQSTTANARAVMQREDVDWVAVLDDGRPRGWVGAAALDGHDRVDGIAATPFPVVVRPEDSLRHALDALVSSPTQVVIVVDDDGRYLGLLDVARIGKGLDT